MESKHGTNIDLDKIKESVQTGVPFSIKVYEISHEVQEYIDAVVTSFLKEIDFKSCSDFICYCVKELSDNAVKANFKHIYFDEKHIDIESYSEAVQAFRGEVVDNYAHYVEKCKKKDIYVCITFFVKNSSFIIDVTNNTSLSVWEYKRMHDKLSRSQLYKSVEEGMSDILDSSEGAGLGLVIMILVLRRLGVSEENFVIGSDEGMTSTRIIIPFDKGLKGNIDKMSVEFVSFIDALPVFPDNIEKIRQMLHSDNYCACDAASLISKDAGLTGELLRSVNTAEFCLTRPCSSIMDAVSLQGMRGIENLLLSIGTMQMFSSISDSEKKSLWTHSYKVARCTSYLSQIFFSGDRYKELRSDAYVCGLLHDMGKLVFEMKHSECMRRINYICRRNNSSPQVFENLVSGSNHTYVGFLVAQKWNFPSVIQDSIRYHHDCDKSPEESRDMVFLVSFADIMVHYLQGELDYHQIEKDILKYFNLISLKDLQGLGEKIKTELKDLSFTPV